MLAIVNKNSVDYSFTPITTPSSLDDRIAIIGAGAAGIHMAYLLKLNGYKNVTVFEKTNRIGGKCYTLEYQNDLHELGAAYLHPLHQYAKQLLQQYDLLDEISYEGRTVWLLDGQAITFEEWIILEAKKYLPAYLRWLPAPVVGIILICLLRKYKRLHENIFDKIESSITYPPLISPPEKYVGELAEPFGAYLKKHNLLPLTPLFLILLTLQGYGFLDTLPTYYVLRWITPSFVDVMICHLLKIKQKTTRYTVLTSGWQNLWEKIVKVENINVRLDVDIKSVTRDSKIRIFGKDRNENKELAEEFDFLILACPLKESLAFLDATPDEAEVFGNQISSTFFMNLFDSTHYNSHAYIDNWFYNIADSSKQYALPGQRFTRVGVDSTTKKQSINEPRVRVAGQYGEIDMDENIIEQMFFEHFAKVGSKNVHIINRVKWKYFWRYNSDGIKKGYPWKIMGIQGTKNTWYAGSSACFETVYSVLNHNRMLVNSLKSPTTKRSLGNTAE